LNSIAARGEAASNLRTAFAPQLSALRIEESLGTGRTAAELQGWLSSVADAHAIEMQKFRFYVGSQDLPAYDEACSKYEDIARLRNLNYTTSQYPHKVVESHINAILKFANPPEPKP
jgi:hypothetical protein